MACCACRFPPASDSGLHARGTGTSMVAGRNGPRNRNVAESLCPAVQGKGRKNSDGLPCALAHGHSCKALERRKIGIFGCFRRRLPVRERLQRSIQTAKRQFA